MLIFISSSHEGGENQVEHCDRSVRRYVDEGTAVDPVYVHEAEDDKMLLGHEADEFDQPPASRD